MHKTVVRQNPEGDLIWEKITLEAEKAKLRILKYHRKAGKINKDYHGSVWKRFIKANLRFQRKVKWSKKVFRRKQ